MTHMLFSNDQRLESVGTKTPNNPYLLRIFIYGLESKYFFLRIFVAAATACLLPILCLAAEAGPSVAIGAGKVLRGDFIQEHHINGVNDPLRSSGNFVVAPNKGIIWATKKPLPTTSAITKDGFCQSVGKFPLFRKASSDMPFIAEILPMITAALAGNWKKLEKDFSIEKNGDASKWKAVLIPKRKEIPFLSLSAKGGKYVESAEVIRKDGGLESVLFLNQSVTMSALTEIERNALASAKIQPNRDPP